MPTTPSSALRIAVLALTTVALGACQDATVPTAPVSMRPGFTQVMSAPVVNTLTDTDDGACDDTHCSLREAVTLASANATITFASSVTGTILVSSDINVTKSLTISGPGPGVLTLSGGDATVVLWFTGGTSTVSGLTITDGYPSLGQGGAVLVGNAGTALTLSNCAITSSDGGYMGGGIRVTGGAAVTVSSCTLSGNSASSGAAIFVADGTGTIVNSTISGNTGNNAVDVLNSAVTIDHSTITANSGTGLYSAYTSPGVSVKASIIWGNAGHDVGAGEDNAFTSLGYNLIGTDDDGWVDLGHDFTSTGDITGGVDAKLGALALNAPGATQTHALLSGSPAIDAGVCTNAGGATIATDQRGVTRPQGGTCDIGAYELAASGSTTPTFAFDFSTLPAKTYGDGPFSIASYVSTNSTGAVTFALGSGSVGCAVSDSTVTISGAAVVSNYCIIEASLAADATYSAAGPISQSFHIAKAAGSVTISNLPASGSVGGSFTPTHTKSGDGTASTVSNSPSICTVTSGVVNYVATGTCLLQASVAEGTDHLAATGTEQSFSIGLITPTFSFDLSTLPAKTFGNGTFSVASYVTENSTGAATFSLGAGSVGCSVTSSGTVTIDSAAADPAHCIIAAALPANGAYAGADPIEQSFNIAKAAASITISNMPSSAIIGDKFTPTFARTGDGSVSVTSLTPSICTVDGAGDVTFIAQGTCTLRASLTEGRNYLAVTGGQQSVNVVPVLGVFASSCTYSLNLRNNQRQVTVTWENANPGVTKIVVADGRVQTKQLAPTTSGSWTTNVKTGTPTYELWGGTARRVWDTSLKSVTACTSQ